MLPLLEEGESTVGVQVDVEHLAPTPLGQTVICMARVINTDKTLITFQFEARDEQEQIARGIHKLRVIRMDRFAKRVQAKVSHSS
jgi:predicted thioesterase